MTTECKSPIPGFKTILMGPTGTGKTSAIRTWLGLKPDEAWNPNAKGTGITPFCIFTEPGAEVLGDIPCPHLHWVNIKPADTPWKTFIDNHQKLNSLSFENLAKMAPFDKKEYHQFIDFLKACNSYKCDRCGESFGDISTWNTDRALCIDGLSGISIMAMREWVGSKSLLNQGDWGVAMAGIEHFIQKFCNGLQCFGMMIAHVERETMEDTGASKVMVSTLGKKLAPKIPRFFSDSILAVRNANKFTWSTADSSTDLKARNLPIADGLPPDFAPMVEKWKKNSGIICPTVAGPPAVPAPSTKA